jgi:hypothetical protein
MAILILVAAAAAVAWPGVSGADGAAWKGRTETREGVTHVLNPDAGYEPARVVETDEVWRRGGEGDDVVFGNIGDIVQDQGGNAYILDTQLSQVHVITRGGRYAGAIGRPGEGPAEFRMPSGLGVLWDQLVCVAQTVPGRVVLMSTAGKAVGDHPLPQDPELGSPFINGCAVVKGTLVLCLARTAQRETSIALKTSFVRIDASGNVLTTYWEQLQEAAFADITFDEKTDASPVWAMGANGRFYVNNDWDAYAIEVVGSDGVPVHVIERQYAHRPRPKWEIEAVETQKRGGEISPETRVAKTSRDVVDLVPRDDGSLWVLSSRGDAEAREGAVGTFDAFDGDGRFVRQITIRGPRRPDRDELRIVGDRVFIVTNVRESAGAAGAADAGELELICLERRDDR